MPETPTTRLGLYKPLNDGSENVNVQTDLNQNWDKVDTAAGFQIVTSSTRPSSPFPGKSITESDTSYRTYFSNGTVPASGSWVEIPNGSGTFGSALTLGNGLTVTGLSALVERGTAADSAYRARVTGDSNSRFLVNADGKITIGDGGSGGDTNLYRSAANVLATDDDFSIIVAGKGLRVKEGSNARMGRSTLVAGTVTVANTSVTAASEIFVTCQTPGGTPGFLRVSARSAGASFTISSSSGTDTSTVGWMLVEPA